MITYVALVCVAIVVGIRAEETRVIIQNGNNEVNFRIFGKRNSSVVTSFDGYIMCDKNRFDAEKQEGAYANSALKPNRTYSVTDGDNGIAMLAMKLAKICSELKSGTRKIVCIGHAPGKSICICVYDKDKSRMDYQYVATGNEKDSDSQHMGNGQMKIECKFKVQDLASNITSYSGPHVLLNMLIDINERCDHWICKYKKYRDLFWELTIKVTKGLGAPISDRSNSELPLQEIPDFTFVGNMLSIYIDRDKCNKQLDMCWASFLTQIITEYNAERTVPKYSDKYVLSKTAKCPSKRLSENDKSYCTYLYDMLALHGSDACSEEYINYTLEYCKYDKRVIDTVFFRFATPEVCKTHKSRWPCDTEHTSFLEFMGKTKEMVQNSGILTPVAGIDRTIEFLNSSDYFGDCYEDILPVVYSMYAHLVDLGIWSGLETRNLGILRKIDQMHETLKRRKYPMDVILNSEIKKITETIEKYGTLLYPNVSRHLEDRLNKSLSELSENEKKKQCERISHPLKKKVCL